MNPQKQLYEFALQNHLKEVVKSEKALKNYLFKKGDPNARVQGDTLLCIVKEQYYMCKILLDAGADVNAPQSDGRSVLEHLMKDTSHYLSLYWDTRSGHNQQYRFNTVSQKMKLFIEHGAQLKDSMMQLAVDLKNPMAVEILVDHKLSAGPDVLSFAISKKAVTLSQKVAMQLPLQEVIDICAEAYHEEFVTQHLETIIVKKQLELSLVDIDFKKLHKL